MSAHEASAAGQTDAHISGVLSPAVIRPCSIDRCFRWVYGFEDQRPVRRGEDMPSSSQSAPADAAATKDVTTLLGRGSEFEGKLSFEATVRIDGKLTGEIFSDDVLIVGEGAEVKAEIN